jgi:hypothetical protein
VHLADVVAVDLQWKGALVAGDHPQTVKAAERMYSAVPSKPETSR